MARENVSHLDCSLTSCLQFPRSSHPGFRFQPVQSRVQRPGLYFQQILRGALNVFVDSVAMVGPESIYLMSLKAGCPGCADLLPSTPFIRACAQE